MVRHGPTRSSNTGRCKAVVAGLLAITLGGLEGPWALFLIQAGAAIWQLELVNYVEHYGLTRKHLGDGKYEHVQPHVTRGTPRTRRRTGC